MFQNANYFLNFSKLLGVTREAKVDNETSQDQILRMYKLGHEIPWDVRKAQPPTQQGVAQAVEEAEAKGLITGLVLDAGCGFGDNGIFLARKGYRVVGFDFSAEAIQVAKDRARDAGVAGLCEFVVADALHLDRSAALRGRRFDTVLDCACLQCFSPNVQPAYLAQIAPLMARRARFLLFVVCNQSQLRSWCRGLTWMERHLEGQFTGASGWKIDEMLHTTFVENIPIIRIVKGVRSFEPVTNSPCLRMIASRRSRFPGPAVIAGAGMAAALAALLLLRRR